MSKFNPYRNTTDRSGDYEQRTFYDAGPEFPGRESDPEQHHPRRLEYTAGWNRAGAAGLPDGIEAAKLDAAAKRKIDAKASHLYVHPPVKGNDAVSAYRSAFEAGYQAQLKHAGA